MRWWRACTGGWRQPAADAADEDSAAAGRIQSNGPRLWTPGPLVLTKSGLGNGPKSIFRPFLQGRIDIAPELQKCVVFSLGPNIIYARH